MDTIELVTDSAFDMWTTTSRQGHWNGPATNSGIYGDWAARTEDKSRLQTFEMAQKKNIESLEAFIAMQREAREARNGALITCFLHMLQEFSSWD